LFRRRNTPTDANEAAKTQGQDVSVLGAALTTHEAGFGETSGKQTLWVPMVVQTVDAGQAAVLQSCEQKLFWPTATQY